jgi:hypothetical protein
MTENLVKLRKSDQIRGKMAMARSKTIVGVINIVARALSLNQPKRGRKLVVGCVSCATDASATVVTAPSDGGRGRGFAFLGGPCPLSDFKAILAGAQLLYLGGPPG